LNYFRVKNFEKFQHYKERNPPWIKIHRSIFEDYEFSCLQDASKLHLVLIWLLASQCDNQLPADPEWLKRKLGVNGRVDVQTLIDKGFLLIDESVVQDASTLHTNADSETEAEAETETETYTPTECEGAFEMCWQKYPRKAGNKKKAFVEFKKTVWPQGDQGVENFLKKMNEYTASVSEVGYLQYGETFFRNWRDMVVSDVSPRKNDNPNQRGEVRI